MKPTLVILAAGMASRYGSMKQVESFGPAGETIMDYSIFDAMRSGFGKVVFIIRRAFEDDFKKVFAEKLKNRIPIEFVFQEPEIFANGFEGNPERTKPWGTAHAVLCAKEVVNEPFAVINADDFYGYQSFKNAVTFLKVGCTPENYAIIGYDLIKTLSAHGTVNRGVCALNNRRKLISVTERLNISQQGDTIVCDDGKEPKTLPEHTKVSMNFWCFHPSFFEHTEKMFHQFLKAEGKALKSEFFIPIVADQFIREIGKIEVIGTSSKWFGVTYKEDAPFVQESIQVLINHGEYPAGLWQ